MFKPFLSLCALFLLVSCGVPKNKIRVEGKFANINQAEFYIYSEDGAFSGVDTVRIDGGKFSYEKELGETAVLTLLFPNFSEMYFVVEPGKTVEISGDAGKLAETSISGTPDNEAVTKFRLAQLHKPEGDVRLAAADYIRTHPKDLASVVLFKQYFVKKAPDENSPALSLLSALRKGRPDDPVLIKLEAFLNPLLQNAKGATLSSFEAATVKGDTVRSSQFRGKPLLIVFFASWNGDSNRLLDAIRRLDRSYGKRCQFLLVSLDLDKERCQKSLTADTLSVPAICDGRAFSSPLISRLGVRYVPGNILVDAQGKILDRDIPVDKLRTRVEEVAK